MANGAAFEDAVEIARAKPGLGIGCHIVLTDGVPLSPPSEIPTLLGPDGKSFRPSLTQFALAVLLDRVREDEIAREATAQVRRLQDAGLTVTHLDTHKHTHILPRRRPPAANGVAERLGIRAVPQPVRAALVARRQPLQLDAPPPCPSALSPAEALRLPAPDPKRLSTNHRRHHRHFRHRTPRRALPPRTARPPCPKVSGNLSATPGYNDSDLDQITTRPARNPRGGVPDSPRRLRPREQRPAAYTVQQHPTDKLRPTDLVRPNPSTQSASAIRC